ncbi:GNAT family N-acetyltransferase [Salirhabdus salicampi]|uniref:GNAT family N-acetyltransferase n=1 Tax=Salirhabdus salicampi TaxID=476102 RepID=UPI0020C1E0A7|nr:GNAT family N-acetyltransferase [Salirhabdus salicampi]MCP8615384.1 GNAT family N-acetyltransferase [Salirhabdus salicampi]
MYIRTETERLIIRPLQLNDFYSWKKSFESRFPSRHSYDEGKIDTSEWTEDWFESVVRKQQELAKIDQTYVFNAFLKEGGDHIGIIDISTLLRKEFQWGRVGYTIHNQYWGRGYGKEAVQEAFKLAFTELAFHRIEAHINVDNKASFRLAESVGMEYECTRKGFIYEFDEWTDNLVYYINCT